MKKNIYNVPYLFLMFVTYNVVLDSFVKKQTMLEFVWKMNVDQCLLNAVCFNKAIFCNTLCEFYEREHPF